MNFFPTYLATGDAFCNRYDERQRIIHNINNGVSVLLISPRRYGKTSLAIKVLEESGLPYANIDLYKAFSEQDVVHFILNGIGELLAKLESAPKKLLALASDIFAKLNVQISYHGTGISVFLQDLKQPNTTEVLLNALEKLDKMALDAQKKVVLFIDEFQVVGEINKNYAIEAVLREIVQKCRGLIFIFSGSNRHLIDQIFNDKKRPFYKICDHIMLERIGPEHYISYIKKAALDRWSVQVEQSVIDKILAVTELHPYYVNKLCYTLWQSEQSPSTESVTNIWRLLILENKSLIERELSRLTIVQRRVLLLLAKSLAVQNIFTQSFIAESQLSIGGLQSATKNLLQADYLYKDSDGYYRILDPMLKGALNI